MLNIHHRPLRASLRQQRTIMNDDADVDDAAYDVRPALVPAEDILVCSFRLPDVHGQILITD